MKTFKDTRFGDLTSQTINHSIILGEEKVVSLKGAPSVVDGDFDITNNKITSLKDCPHKILGSFRCYNNKLTTLEGGPTTVTVDYDCGGHNNIYSLKGAPESVGGQFNVYGNPLDSFQYAPKFIGTRFTCQKVVTITNQIDEIIKNGIIAEEYWTDEGKFKYADLAERFQNHEKLQKGVQSKGFRTLLGINK